MAWLLRTKIQEFYFIFVLFLFFSISVLDVKCSQHGSNKWYFSAEAAESLVRDPVLWHYLYCSCFASCFHKEGYLTNALLT